MLKDEESEANSVYGTERNDVKIKLGQRLNMLSFCFCSARAKNPTNSLGKRKAVVDDLANTKFLTHIH